MRDDDGTICAVSMLKIEGPDAFAYGLIATWRRPHPNRGGERE